MRFFFVWASRKKFSAFQKFAEEEIYTKVSGFKFEQDTSIRTNSRKSQSFKCNLPGSAVGVAPGRCENSIAIFELALQFKASRGELVKDYIPQHKLFELVTDIVAMTESHRRQPMKICPILRALQHATIQLKKENKN